MTNILTVNLKSFLVLLLFACVPFLLVAESVEEELPQTFNCPIEDLVINCTNDINNEIDAWLSTSNDLFKSSLPIGFTITNNYNNQPPRAVCIGSDNGLSVTFTATDSEGASQTCSAFIRIIDDEIRIEQCPTTDLVLSSTDNIEQAITAWVNSSAGLVQTAAENPEGCDRTGEITVVHNYNGNPPVAVCQVIDGGLLVAFTATDECGNSATCAATIFIIDNEVVLEQCPTTDLILNTSDNIEIAINSWLDWTTDLMQATATNPEGNDGLGDITVTNDYAGVLPIAVCGGNGDGLIVTFTASDECGNTATCQGKVVILDNEAPVIDCSSVSDITVACNYDISSNNIGTPLVTDNATLSNEIILTTEDDQSGLSACGGTGTILRTFTATDNCGNTSTCKQSITIINESPILNCNNLDVTIDCTASRNENVPKPLVSDDCTSTNELGVSFVDDESNLSNCDGYILRTWTATDACGLTSTCVQTITITDAGGPIISCNPLNYNHECNGDAGNEFAALAWDSANLTSLRNCTYDNCGGGILVKSTLVGENLGCGKTGSITKNYTITDGCGNTINKTATFTIVDTTDPQVSCQPDDIFLECVGSEINQRNAAAWNAMNIAKMTSCAFDLCGNITVTSDYDFNNLSEGCETTGSLIVTYTIADECDNSVTTQASYTIEDTSDPIVSCEPTDKIHECNGQEGNRFAALSWNQANIVILQNCSSDDCGEITVTSDYNFNNFSNFCGLTGTIVTTYTITDECGNSTTKTATFTISDETAPITNYTLPNTVINCIDVPNVKQFLIDKDAEFSVNLSNVSFDECGSITVTSDFDASSIDDNCQTQPETSVTYTIADECDNQITQVWNYTIINQAISNPLCENIQIQNTDNQLTISNVSAPNIITKVFDSNWQIISNCSGDCPETVTISDLVAGEIYHTDIQLYDENWNFICEDKQDIELIGGSEPCDTSVCQGDLLFTNQAEIDAFCGCEVIRGNLILGLPNANSNGLPKEIFSLEPFYGIKRIEGHFAIVESQIKDYSGLETLEFIGGGFASVYNFELLSFKGLENLKYIVNNLAIFDNNKLVDVSNFEKLDTVGSQINIENNNALTQIRGFNNLTSLGENLEPETSKNISLSSNDNLQMIAGFEKLKIVPRLFINSNPLLKTIQLLPVARQYTTVTITRNDKLTDIILGVDSVIITSDLTIELNPLLEDCCLFENLVDNNEENGQVLRIIKIKDNKNFCNSPEAILQACQTPPPLCENIQITTQNNQIIVSGLTAANEIVKVFDKDYNIIYQCNATCEDRQIKGDFVEGTYVVDLQLYNENWELICSEQRTVILENTTPCNTTDCETIPPVLANIPADETVECDAIPSVPNNVTATDNCDSDVEIVFQEERTNGSCQDTYILTRTWTASDDCGNSTAAVQVIAVQDATEPVFSNLPPDLTFNASEGFDTTFPTATDNCDAEVEITVDDALNTTETEIVRTFTATDNCGNTITAQQIITIIQDENNLCDNLLISTTANEIKFTNIDAPNAIVKVFDAKWQIIFECTASCESELVVPVSGEGVYHTDVQFYDEKWVFICLDKQDIEVLDGGEPCDTSVCQGDVVLRTQAEVDAFCGCEVIEGKLDIGTQFADINNRDTSDIHDLSNLLGLKLIKESLEIKQTMLKNLKGLDSLETIGINLALGVNRELISLAGLEKLQSTRSLSITYSDRIEHLDNLESVSDIGNYLILANNPQLKSIAGLASMQTASLSRLSIVNNDNLANLDGLESLQSILKPGVTGNLSITGNDNLTNINSLRNIRLVENALSIFGNPKLSECCGVAHLLDFNLDNGQVLGNIRISDNLSFCSTRSGIQANCEIPDQVCESIQINAIHNEILIKNNVSPIAIIKVFDTNYNIVYECFADCGETINLTDLAAGSYHIIINAYDENWQAICERKETVEIETTTQDRHTDFSPTDFTLFPNPAKTEAFIDLSKLKGEKVELVLFNQFGQEVSQQVIDKITEQKEVIDLSTMQNGLYILKIKSKNRKLIAKKLLVSRLY